MMRRSYVSWALILAGLVAICSPARGQPKEDPPPVDNSPPPIDTAGFAEAYKRANEPEMIVICGVVAGADANGERKLANFDPSADSDALRRRLEEKLLEARVELKEQSALDDVHRRDLALLAQQGEKQIIEALKEKFQADVAVLAQMQPRGRDAKYRVTVDTLSVTRGSKIGTFSFDWEKGDDARSVKAYGDAIIRKVMEQFIKFYLPGKDGAAEMRYNVLLVGVQDNAAIRAAQSAFEQIKGVSQVRVRGNTDAGGRKATTIQINYAGAMFDLAVDLEETASKVLGYRVDGTDATAGSITMIAGAPVAAAPPPEDPCKKLFDPASDGNALFKQLYKSQGRPRVTILINREAFKGERQNQEFSGIKWVGPSPGDTTHPLLQTATAENSLAEWFKRLDIRIVNADQVRQRIQQSSGKAADVLKDDELRKLLKDGDVADILVLGRGGIITSDGSIWYTFEATRMGGDNLGNARWTADSAARDVKAVDAAFDELGHNVVCKLSLDMMAEWRGNARIDVTVTNVKDPNQVYAIMDDMKKGNDAIVSTTFASHDGGREGGAARFSVEYKSGYEEFARKLSEQAPRGSIKLAVQSTSREAITLRVGGTAAATQATP